MAVRIAVFKNQVRAKVDYEWKKALPEIGKVVLDDINEFCKEDTGALIASSYKYSDLSKGYLRWKTPYARRQYWLINTRTEKNPNATWKWCEAARQKYRKKWAALAKQVMRDKNGGKK